MIRKIQWIAMVVAAVLCAACDAHIDVPDRRYVWGIFSARTARHCPMRSMNNRGSGQ